MPKPRNGFIYPPPPPLHTGELCILSTEGLVSMEAIKVSSN